MLVRSLRALPAARPAVGLRGMTTLLAMRRVPAARAAPVAVLQQPRRWLAGTAFLDEADVTDRVLGCVKAFQKVDAAKVTAQSHFLNDLGLDSLDTVEVSASTTPLLPPPPSLRVPPFAIPVRFEVFGRTSPPPAPALASRSPP